MSTIKFEGLEKLQRNIEKNIDMADVKRVVMQNGSDLQAKAQDKAPVDTGTLKRSIGLELSDGGLAATVEPTAEYAAYVEFGTRKMEAQPYLKPAFDEQVRQFHRDMQKLVR